MIDVKFDPPDFKGTFNLDVYLEWIQTVEIFFEVKGYSNEKSFEVGILKLKKYASLWYKNTNNKRTKEGKSQITT